MCLPKLTAAECVDHIKAISSKDDPMFWKADNHQGLCWSCHSNKTATEDGGFRGKDYKPKKKITTGLDGWPIDD